MSANSSESSATMESNCGPSCIQQQHTSWDSSRLWLRSYIPLVILTPALGLWHLLILLYGTSSTSWTGSTVFPSTPTYHFMRCIASVLKHTYTCVLRVLDHCAMLVVLFMTVLKLLDCRMAIRAYRRQKAPLDCGMKSNFMGRIAYNVRSLFISFGYSTNTPQLLARPNNKTRRIIRPIHRLFVISSVLCWISLSDASVLSDAHNTQAQHSLDEFSACCRMTHGYIQHDTYSMNRSRVVCAETDRIMQYNASDIRNEQSRIPVRLLVFAHHTPRSKFYTTLTGPHFLLSSWTFMSKRSLAFRLRASFDRMHMRQHDFKVYREKFTSCSARYYLLYACQNCLLTPIHKDGINRVAYSVVPHVLRYNNGNSSMTSGNTRDLRLKQAYGGGPSKPIFKIPNLDRIPKSLIFSFDTVSPYIEDSQPDVQECSYYYLGSTTEGVSVPGAMLLHVPLHILCARLPRAQLLDLAKLHDITVGNQRKLAVLRQLLIEHTCVKCDPIPSVFMLFNPKSSRDRMRSLRVRRQEEAMLLSQDVDSCEKHPDSIFPPDPPSKELLEDIMNGFISESSPAMIEEEGCAVCATLHPIHDMIPLNNIHELLYVLNEYVLPDPITRRERRSSEEPITALSGIPLAPQCDKVCKSCSRYLEKEKMPPLSLANGLWIGEVPSELQDLSFAEQMLICRVRHNSCLVRVSSGMHKLRANAILYQTPIPKVYNILPPALDDLDEVLAIIYTGHCAPTQEDFKKTPFLVRRNKVAHALEWLRINHIDYADIIISQENLMSYPEDMPPVTIGFRKNEDEGNKDPESTGLDDNEHETGTSEGDCPVTVHGLIGSQLSAMDVSSKTAAALDHLKNGGKVLAVGHAEQPESMYNNPQLYPQMFPWLFPYGLGGIGNTRGPTKISAISHKKHLLMYHDKRFQNDAYFPIIAMNHEQVKSAITGGSLLTSKKSFPRIAERILSINPDVLRDLSRRMTLGEHICTETEEERACFQLIRDLDHIAYHVDGSITSKKYMRNEVWSLTAYKGAPSWFITFSPADVKHPICLYYADRNIVFKPKLLSDSDGYRLIANNPVAGARFFDLMVRLFIKHVLGVGTDHTGLYGDTSAYYGTVEQQGRLTLHLHLLLWIRSSLTPQEIRDRILEPSSEFQQRMISYLESVHTGDFSTGNLETVRENIEKNKMDENYKDPTMTLPESIPKKCDMSCSECTSCKDNDSWWNKFWHVFDDVLYRSNRHKCGIRCMANKHNSCRARFPREVNESTTVDKMTGSIVLKKLEAWINTVTPYLTYLLKCNTDVTSMLSGTAIKSVIAYTTEYVTKPGLKTHVIFDIIRMLIDKKYEMLGSDMPRQEKARRLLTSIVNSLTAKLEMGGPMASLYLLGNPDHYTSHTFRPFYWKSYVNEVMSAWKPTSVDELEDDNMYAEEKVVIMRSDDDVVGTCFSMDYMHRSTVLEHMSLYDTIRVTSRSKGRPGKNAESKVPNTDTDSDFHESSESCVINLDEQETNNVRLGKHGFTDAHPLHKTHVLSVFPESRAKVPNFIGGSLPRKDQGDREYYCCTMLTLFKPWRTGFDLKTTDQSWSEAFDEYAFTDRQQEVMKFFNLRYECLDAKDDFSKHRNAHGIANFSTEEVNSLDQDAHNESLIDDAIDLNDTDFDDPELIRIGESGMNWINAAREVSSILRSSGWMNDVIDNLTPMDPQDDFVPAAHSVNQWKQILKNAKDIVLQLRATHYESFKDNKHKLGASKRYIDQAEIVDDSYLRATYKPTDPNIKQLADNVVVKYTLNNAQERAFRIIANHTVHPNPEQLKMYLGGMAGTGKSQVIKALINFFSERGEQHRFITLAPTGSAAALIDGSTYHSVLGIDNSSDKTDTVASLSDVKKRLDGVDYIFIDEVSMLSCNDVYNISERLAKVLDEATKPFGGKNIIFAGDFAQLQPVQARSLYNHNVGISKKDGTKEYYQREAIGKSLWHQITTVVILRENMRQKTQSARDAMFRTALENMRYKMCTQEDVKFLKTLVAGHQNHQPRLAQARFRHVSIITAYNQHKDHINELGVHRFANDYNQELHTFHAEDKWSDVDVKDKGGLTRRIRSTHAVVNPLKNTGHVTGRIKDVISDVPPAASNHFAGKLMLCKGMPILIKRNEATECCVTNGAEATVYNWVSTRKSDGRERLEVLFVRLSNPPRTIQIPDLPVNVVPITRHSKKIACILPNDHIAHIDRSQVMVLPNFSMTDYAAQGRTRPNNVVDLHNCKTHQSYYTCLSRSSSADGTIIVQSFDASRITGGASAELKQEFRELEILDDITTMKYYETLHPNVDGHRRHDIIRKFQGIMGANYVPKHAHKSIRWSTQQPFELNEKMEHQEWRIVEKPNRKKKQQTNGATQVTVDDATPGKPNTETHNKIINSKDATIVPPTEKHDPNGHCITVKTPPAKTHQTALKNNESDTSNSTSKKHDIEDKHIHSMSPLTKKQKVKPYHVEEHVVRKQYSIHTGIEWDAEDYSCAYDAVFNCLYLIWFENQRVWSEYLGQINPMLTTLIQGFKQTHRSNSSMQITRNIIRADLHAAQPAWFPWGPHGAAVGDIVYMMLRNDMPSMTWSLECSVCGIPNHQESIETPMVLGTNGNATPQSTQLWFTEKCSGFLTESVCHSAELRWTCAIKSPLLMFPVQGRSIDISKYISVIDGTGVRHTWRLASIIYYKRWHFTCINIDTNGNMWYSDSRTIPNAAVYAANVQDISEQDIRLYQTQRAEVAVYSSV